MSNSETLILHLGFGQFHRAHQAKYFSDLQRQGFGKVKVIPFSARGSEQPAAFAVLAEQNNRYTLTVAHDQTLTTEFIQIHAPGIFGVVNFLTLPKAQKQKIKWFTITATEKSYALGPEGIVDTVCQILREFFSQQLRPPVVVSCDNILLNGDALKRLIIEANAKANYFSAHELNQIKTPNSLVDRIVPAQRPEWPKVIAETQDFHDGLCVFTEPYSQWVIEDAALSSSEKLGLDQVGIEFVKDIRPYIQQKLFLLNGAHSLLTYLGLEKGHATVAQAIADKSILDVVRKYWFTEVIPVLPDTMDHRAYCNSLETRFKNRFLNHSLSQIAQDGFHKIRQRWLPVLALNMQSGSTRAMEIGTGLKSFYGYAAKNLGVESKLEFVDRFQLDKDLAALVTQLVNE